MTRIEWNTVGSKIFEHGVDRGVLYLKNADGAPWSGITNIFETPGTIDQRISYIDGAKKTNQLRATDFGLTLEALTYPETFENYKGYFNLSYRTKIGNDEAGIELGYQIHLVYNCVAIQQDLSYNSSSLDDDITPFSWEVHTKPGVISGAKPTSHLIIDSRYCYQWTLESLENYIYGDEVFPSRFPTLEMVFNLFEDGAILIVTDHGDGTWSAEERSGHEGIISLSGDYFEINWPSAINISSEKYTLHSL